MSPKERIEWLEILLGSLDRDERESVAQALREVMIDYRQRHTENPADTVRVRIAVIADKSGHVGASGVYQGHGDEDAMSDAYEWTFGGPENFKAQAFVEADIPLIPTVKAQVVEPTNGQ